MSKYNFSKVSLTEAEQMALESSLFRGILYCCDGSQVEIVFSTKDGRKKIKDNIIARTANRLLLSSNNNIPLESVAEIRF